jgi:hypothetical protein
MLLLSLRAPYLAPGGPGSMWNYLGAPVRSTGVSGRFACGFRTELHFGDVVVPSDPVKEIEHVFLLTHLGDCLGRVHNAVSGRWPSTEIVILDFLIDPRCVIVDTSAVL